MATLSQSRFSSNSATYPRLRTDARKSTAIEIMDRHKCAAPNHNFESASACLGEPPIGGDFSRTGEAWDLKDPAGYVDGANVYQMEGSNPIDRTDPSGYDFIAIGDCRVVGIADLLPGDIRDYDEHGAAFFHYSIEVWTGCPPKGEVNIADWQPNSGSDEIDAVQLGSEQWSGWMRVDFNGIELSTNIFVSVISYGRDTATKMMAIPNTFSWDSAVVSTKWNAILAAAKSYKYAEQPDAKVAANWPNSMYEVKFGGNNSNTFAESTVVAAGLTWGDLSSMHPGADSPHTSYPVVIGGTVIGNPWPTGRGTAQPKPQE